MIIATPIAGVLNLPIINTIFQTIEQTIVPPDKIGRVMSIDSTLPMMITPIGVILTGILSVLIGVTNLFLYCGIAITLATYVLTKIRHYDNEKDTVSDTLDTSDEKG